ncbi:HNH endonuclease signature motif containing protein [Brachybacterium phenoliresistens]|uniref:HNH nuclease domain-containing protein n=1 Tax=Brachybacterium phenoliresistens TaxID=396014 RepID=Z9JXK0_9MICO|nr:HNH endonuclease signature motif containing protein [Brachybacterium phenoliresistens]EWS82748.1 hypothetical protein BF93_06915 [Brachybacterium phenoliresistens]
MDEGVPQHIGQDGAAVPAVPQRTAPEQQDAASPAGLDGAVAVIRAALEPLAGTPALSAVVDLVGGAARAAGLSRSTQRAVVDVEPGTPDEALAMLAMLSQTRTSLGAVEDAWMLEAAARIRRENGTAGASGRRLDAGVTANIAVARRTSRHSASAALTAARRLSTSMPVLQEAKSTARLPEATVAAVSAVLADEPPAVCEAVDAEIGRDLAQLDGLGITAVREHVEEIVQKRSDPIASRERAVRAARRRYLKITPQRHGMARLTAVLPALGAVQIEAVVQAAAESARAAGGSAPVGAARVDVLVEAVNYYCDALSGDPPVEVAPCMPEWIEEDSPLLDLGTGEIIAPVVGAPAASRQDAPRGEPSWPPGPLGSACGPQLSSPAPLGAAPPGPLPPRGGPMPDSLFPPGRSRIARPAAPPRGPRIELLVTITDRALFHLDDGTEHAALSGYGLAPSRAVTNALAGSPYGDFGASDAEADARAEALAARMVYRRLYTHPASGELVAMDSTSRAFPVNTRRMLLSRDRVCRVPYCNAGPRHLDHIHAHAQGGATAFSNGQGLCAAGNYDKETGRWRVEVVADAQRPGATRVVWVSPYGAVGSSPTPPSQRPPTLNRAERRTARRRERLSARAKERAVVGRTRAARRRAARGSAARGSAARGSATRGRAARTA